MEDQKTTERVRRPTWDEVRARSEQTLSGVKVHCGDCEIAWHHGELPCRKHATPEESAAIYDAVAAALERIADHPLVKATNRMVGWE